MPLYVLDQYYLSITFLVSFAMQFSAFIVSFSLQTDKLTDLMGSLNFLVLSIMTLTLGQHYQTRNLLASIFVMLWSTRLGGFLFYRVLKTGKDGRFDEMRSKFFSFGAFWTFQLFWCWIVSFPITILNSPAVSQGGNVKFGTASDIAGIIMFWIGFLLEVVGDTQKFVYKKSKPPRGDINDHGVWNWTRHPNFFGEILLWWGLYSLCIQPAVSRSIPSNARNALLASVLSPIFITLLLFFVSGLPLAEKPTSKRYWLMTYGGKKSSNEKWEEYSNYLNRTSILIPIPPFIYEKIPTFLKRTILLDLPMFAFDPLKDGPAALEEEKAREGAP